MGMFFSETFCRWTEPSPIRRAIERNEYEKKGAKAHFLKIAFNVVAATALCMVAYYYDTVENGKGFNFWHALLVCFSIASGVLLMVRFVNYMSQVSVKISEKGVLAKKERYFDLWAWSEIKNATVSIMDVDGRQWRVLVLCLHESADKKSPELFGIAAEVEDETIAKAFANYGVPLRFDRSGEGRDWSPVGYQDVD